MDSHIVYFSLCIFKHCQSFSYNINTTIGDFLFKAATNEQTSVFLIWTLFNELTNFMNSFFVNNSIKLNENHWMRMFNINLLVTFHERFIFFELNVFGNLDFFLRWLNTAIRSSNEWVWVEMNDWWVSDNVSVMLTKLLVFLAISVKDLCFASYLIIQLYQTGPISLMIRG